MTSSMSHGVPVLASFIGIHLSLLVISMVETKRFPRFYVMATPIMLLVFLLFQEPDRTLEIVMFWMDAIVGWKMLSECRADIMNSTLPAHKSQGFRRLSIWTMSALYGLTVISAFSHPFLKESFNIDMPGGFLTLFSGLEAPAFRPEIGPF